MAWPKTDAAECAEDKVCACKDPTFPPAPAGECAPKLSLSLEEERICSAMRVAKLTVRALCREADLRPPPERCLEIDQELSNQRQRFRALKAELEVANRAKLKRLGHQV